MNTTAATTTGLATRQQSVSVARGLIAVLAGALLMTLAAHAKIPLPGSPVPITLQTLVVLLLPLAVGPWLAVGGITLFLGVGLAGPGLFAVATGATSGYLIGFGVAPLVIGAVLAQRRQTPGRTLAALSAGLATVFGLGLLGLAAWGQLANLSLPTLLLAGLVPFLPGEALKLAVALISLPLMNRIRQRWYAAA
jgi:biotin transport system substrate-specific component